MSIKEVTISLKSLLIKYHRMIWRVFSSTKKQSAKILLLAMLYWRFHISLMKLWSTDLNHKLFQNTSPKSLEFLHMSLLQHQINLLIRLFTKLKMQFSKRTVNWMNLNWTLLFICLKFSRLKAFLIVTDIRTTIRILNKNLI